MKLQVEEALKEAGKSFPFSFECPAAELGEVEDLPWKDATVVVDGAYWFDGNHMVVQGNHTDLWQIHLQPLPVTGIGGSEGKHCLKSMVRKQSFPRTYCPIMGSTSI